MRYQVCTAWWHIQLSQQICPRDTLACCWDVKQTTYNKYLTLTSDLILSLLSLPFQLFCQCNVILQAFVHIVILPPKTDSKKIPPFTEKWRIHRSICHSRDRRERNCVRRGGGGGGGGGERERGKPREREREGDPERERYRETERETETESEKGRERDIHDTDIYRKNQRERERERERETDRQTTDRQQQRQRQRQTDRNWCYPLALSRSEREKL